MTQPKIIIRREGGSGFEPESITVSSAEEPGAEDRRINQRVATDMSAVLNYDMHALICTVKDISPTGAFIETDPAELPLSRSIELGMQVETKEGPKYYRLPVLIRRVTENGAGVSFGDVEGEAYFNLVDLVYRA
jgi:hypothetical protein